MTITDRRSGLNIGAAFKPACYVASTANLTLSSTQSIDGIIVGATDQRVLVKDQTEQTENGIYNPASGSWTRAKDMDGTYDAIPGTLAYVDRGTVYGETVWALNSSSTATNVIIAGHSTGDNLAWSRLTPAIDGSQPIVTVVFDDYLTDGLNLAKGAAAPDLAEFRDGLFLNAFAGTGGVTEQAYFSHHILHGMKPGSTPTFHIHWAHNQAGPSGNVKWQLDYSIAKGYGAGSYAAPTTLTATQTALAQYVHNITDDDDMPLASITEIEPDTVLIGRIYRDPTDGADTFEADAFLIQIDMHVQIDKIGTLERNRPFTGF